MKIYLDCYPCFLRQALDAAVSFLPQTKCPVIAYDVGVPVRSIVFKQGQA